MVKLPKYHALSFLHDNDDRCALTALVNGEWYHIAVDPTKLSDRSKKGKAISREYRRLIGQVKAEDQDDEGQGTAPLFVQEDEGDSDSEGERDSAVDVSTPESDDTEDEVHQSKPAKALERWMLKPVARHFSDKKTASEDKERNLQDWYHCPKHYVDLLTKDGELLAQEDESPPEAVTKRIDRLIPAMPLPKYIWQLDIPSINAKDLTVLGESSEPAPIHPTRVRWGKDGKEYFLKLVDPNQYKPTKREIQVMHTIEAEGLHEKLRVPLLRGLVHFADTPRHTILGFIMDAIDDPTPLTLLIDSKVDEAKRTRWAEEAAEMVDVLHQHGIVWGDAKGDNFMVDKDDQLWIIDFGGSYTEGWIDPELNETEEGDEMGVRKLCNGLRDPEANTLSEKELDDQQQRGPQNDETEQYGEKSKPKTGNKRKAQDDEATEPETSPARKQHRKDLGTKDEELRYCYCDSPESGRMLACDGEDCKKEWFHFTCIGIEEAPREKEWYCKDCRAE